MNGCAGGAYDAAAFVKQFLYGALRTKEQGGFTAREFKFFNDNALGHWGGDVIK